MQVSNLNLSIKRKNTKVYINCSGFVEYLEVKMFVSKSHGFFILMFQVPQAGIDFFIMYEKLCEQK